MNPQDKIKQLEKENRDLKEALRLRKKVFKHLPDQIWAHEEGHKIFMTNNNIDQMISSFSKAPLRDFEGEYLFDIMQNKAPKPLLEMIRRNDEITLKTGRLMVFEEKAWMNGEPRVYLSRKKRYIDPDTKKVYLLGTSMDITGMRKEEERMMNLVNEMKEVSIAKQTFIQNFRHDLQTPISNILGVVDLILHSPKDPDINFFIESVQASTLKLKQYMDQLEEITTEKKKDQAVEIVAVNIQELLKNVVSSFHILAKNNGLKLNLVISKNLPEFINSDQVRLYRIVSNLVSNAIKYTQEGAVDIEVFYLKTDEGSLLEIQVSDTGVGIDLSHHKSIFSPMMRVHREETLDSEGQGLGLSIVKQFVEDLHGQISVNSAVGQGSQFIVMIPLDITIGG